MNILLVEDDPTDLLLFSVVLYSDGHCVEKNTSAEEAVVEIKARKPDLVLLDLNLPGMDGLALTRHLREDESTCDLPIVAVTAANEEFSRRAAFAAGCDAYIVKPVDTRKLSDEIISIVAKKARTRGQT